MNRRLVADRYDEDSLGAKIGKAVGALFFMWILWHFWLKSVCIFIVRLIRHVAARPPWLHW